MKFLIIDNYDSFVYNIAQRLGELGINSDVIRNDKVTIAEIRDGDYTSLPFLDEQIEIRGEIKDKDGLISTAIKIAKKEMREKLGDDYVLVEALYTYDDIISILNLTNERLLEWERITEIKGKNQSQRLS